MLSKSSRYNEESEGKRQRKRKGDNKEGKEGKVQRDTKRDKRDGEGITNTVGRV